MSDLSPPEDLETSVPTTTALVPFVDAQVATFVAQPVPSSTNVPSLDDDVRAAQNTAAEWTNPPDAIRDQVVACLQGVVDMDAQVNAAYAAMSAALTQILAGDASAIDDFQAALAPLQATTTTNQQLCASTDQTLSNWVVALDSSVSQMQADAYALQTEIAGDQGSIAQLEAEIDSTEDDIDYWELFLLGLTIISPLAGWIATLLEELFGSLGDLENQLAEAEQELADMEADLAELNAELSMTTSYIGDVSNLAANAQQMSDGWAILAADYQTLLDSEDINTFNAFTQAQLDAMVLDWNVLAEEAATVSGVQLA